MAWPVVTLEEISSKPQYGAIARGSTEPIGPLFIRQTDIATGRIDWSSVPYCDLGADEFEKFAVRPGDLLISRLGNGVGNAAIVQESNDAVFAGYLVRFQPNSDIATPAFVGYQLQSEAWRRHVKGFRSGAAQPTLNARQMGDFSFLLPPIAEQRSIAATLGALDDKIDSNLRVLSTLDLLLQAHWKRTADECLGAERLGDMVTTQYGLTASAEVVKDAPKFLRVTDINKENWLTWSKVPNAKVSAEELEKYGLHNGDLLVARMADPGKSAIFDDDIISAVFASYLVRLKARDYAEALYIYGFLKSTFYSDYAAGAMSGSVQKNMNARVMVAVDMPWPTQRNLDAFAGIAETLRSQINQEAREITALECLRNTLLPQLLSGQIRASGATKAVLDVADESESA